MSLQDEKNEPSPYSNQEIADAIITFNLQCPWPDRFERLMHEWSACQRTKSYWRKFISHLARMNGSRGVDDETEIDRYLITTVTSMFLKNHEDIYKLVRNKCGRPDEEQIDRSQNFLGYVNHNPEFSSPMGLPMVDMSNQGYYQLPIQSHQMEAHLHDWRSESMTPGSLSSSSSTPSPSLSPSLQSMSSEFEKLQKLVEKAFPFASKSQRDQIALRTMTDNFVHGNATLANMLLQMQQGQSSSTHSGVPDIIKLD